MKIPPQLTDRQEPSFTLPRFSRRSINEEARGFYGVTFLYQPQLLKKSTGDSKQPPDQAQLATESLEIGKK
ncbi:hypothetical protein PT974_10912 [Cladobotryum mycophilum]|uniref:Uncharacterized protein n=1 Tax=Cladobotryum mycophilum TaxID=491253 RepID=A0ABR0SB54_9HYPO